MTAQAPSKLNVNVGEVVDYLRMKGRFAPALKEVVERKVTVQAAREEGYSVSDEELQKAADTFRQVKGLQKVDDTQEWLQSRGLELEDLEEYLEENLLIDKMKNAIEDDASQEEYLESEPIQEQIREMAYSDWLQEEIENGA